MKHNQKVTLVYQAGNYPTTMQAYFDKYDQKLYDEVYKVYLAKYYGEKGDNYFVYHGEANDKYYLNFTAFLILDSNQHIKSFAFEEFNDLVWILKVINIDQIELELDECVYEKIKTELSYYPFLTVKENNNK